MAVKSFYRHLKIAIFHMVWKKFIALGTEIVIVASLSREQERKNLLSEAVKIVFDFEEKFSRFLAGNELDRFNNFPGGEFKASRTFFDLLKEAKRANLITKGIFEPAVIGSLERSGYDRSFSGIDKLKGRKINPGKIAEEFFKQPKIGDLEILGDKIVKPEGLRLDLGGLGKGYIADFLGDHLFGRVSDFWISAGGDIYIKGHDEGAPGWKVGIEDPNRPERKIFSINTGGEKIGIATSGIFKRKGQTGSFSWHHIIDPRSGLPAENNVLAVTAVSGSAKRADVFAKTVLILGERAGLEFIDGEDDSAALIFLKNGQAVFSKRALSYFKT